MKTTRSAAVIRTDINKTNDQLLRTQSWKRQHDLERHLLKLKREYLTARAQEGEKTWK